MTPDQIKKELNQYQWNQWIKRDFGAFMMSLFTQDSDFKKIGIDIEMIGFVFQNGSYYSSNKVFKKLSLDLEKWMVKNHKNMFDISDSYQKFYEKSKRRINKLTKEKDISKEAMKGLRTIFNMSSNYIWLAHGLEEMYMEKLRVEIPKYWKGDIELFIGDICFPEKKNAHAIFEDKLKTEKDLGKIAKEFGWIKIRNGFDDPFTIEEVRELKEKMKNDKDKPRKKIKAPKEIKDLVEEVKELVFYRTYRTDVFYELLFLSRPIFEKYAISLGLEFKDLRNYRIDDLIEGVIKKYPPLVTVGQYKTDYAFFDKDIVEDNKIISEEIKGSIAFLGTAKGLVRIVNSVQDLSKVKEGDVLVTNMTTPNYLIAMKRAVAFVTDEGGITCHAAIVAREMKKPCIIGTKNATKVLKDGDLVEVDATKGIVKIIKESKKT